MRMSRRAVLHGIGGGGVSFSYTGTYESFGNETQGFAVLKTSGTLTIAGTVDLCLVGGGGKGKKGVSSYGGGGGAGGFVQNFLSQVLNGNLDVTIGNGSSTEGSVGGQTSVGASYTANGGNSPTARAGGSGRGTGGTGAATGVNGTKGEDGVFPWDDSVNFSGYRVSGCGGGGGFNGKAGGLGGAGGGGNANASGTANTGGGGGGGTYYITSQSGGNGGSGVVLICWGYNH